MTAAKSAYLLRRLRLLRHSSSLVFSNPRREKGNAMIEAHFNEGITNYLPQPASPRPPGNWGVVKTSYEVYGVSRITKVSPDNWKLLAFPDVWRINPTTLKFEDGSKKPEVVEMTSDFQHWLFRLNAEKYFGKPFKDEQDYREWWASLDSKHQLIRWFTSLLTKGRSHTNVFGLDNCRNYISGANMDAELPRFSNLVTGRWVAKVLSLETRGIFGVESISVEVINFSKGYRQFNPQDHWWLFDEPLLSGRRRNADGTVDETLLLPYPQFEPARPILPVILPVDSRAWIPVEIFRVLHPEEKTPGKYEFPGR